MTKPLMNDDLNRRLVVLLQQRAELMKVVAHAKQKLGTPILDPEREAAVMKVRHQWAHELGLDEKFVDVIWGAIMDYSRALQAKDS